MKTKLFAILVVLFFINIISGFAQSNGTAANYTLEGYEFYKLGDYTTAIVCFTRAIEHDPYELRNYFYRGDSYSRLEQYQNAINDCNTFINLNTNVMYFEQTLLVWITRGRAYISIGKYDEAINDFTHVIITGTRETSNLYDLYVSLAYHDRSRAYSAINNNNSAISDLTNSIRLNPNSASSYYFRGLLYASNRDYRNAKDDFYRATQLDPTNQQYLYFYQNIPNP